MDGLIRDSDEARVRDMAAVAFEPVNDALKMLNAFDGDSWSRRADALQINARIASLIVSKSKDDLVGLIRGIGYEATTDIVECLISTQKEAEALNDLLSSAFNRMMVAVAVTVEG